ncbi:hypothetical protein RSOLAG22IIIB_09738 [Rhizoctonia solani]|uniref:Uncharacterized protein n=1 Tax=Rhizoctonia solani TaxID=456999 RepID=A0A0K6FZD0_9AGAM|nr:hypothetical protein RSOLAG22IIIB_09738 [Rhizoctonia solani]
MSALYELQIQEFKLTSQRIKDIKAVKKLRNKSHLQRKRTGWSDKVHESLPSSQVKLYPLLVDQTHVDPLSENIKLRVNVCHNEAQIDWSAYRDCVKQLRPYSILGGDKLVPKPIEDGLRMCATRIWLSIEECSGGSRSDKYPDIIAKLKNQEVLEREKIRAGFIC